MNLFNQINNDWTDVVSKDRNDLVFTGRNQNYGAYQIRREYDQVLSFALLLTVSGFLLASILLGYSSRISESIVKLKVDLIKETEIVLQPPPAQPPVEKIEETKPEPKVKKNIEITPVANDTKIEEQKIEEKTVVEQSPVGAENTGATQTGTEPHVGTVKVEKPIVEEAKDWAEVMPLFPGGQEAMLRFLRSNIKYPELAKEMGIQGIVYVSFIVEKDGSIGAIKILRSVAGGKDLEVEATRVVALMPKWAPGMQGKESVRVWFNLPVNFKLN